MNLVEKFVYDLLKNNPKVKLFIRNIYQSFCDFIPDKPDYTKYPVIEREGFFFGFHDISPYSADDKYLAANKIFIPLRMPKNDDYLGIGYFKGNNDDKYIKIDETSAWNWHKGCRLQWIGDSNRLIYNYKKKDILGSKIFNLDNSNSCFIHFPIDTVSNNGKFATSFSYSRLNRFMPGYGYNYIEKEKSEERSILKESGLFLVDLVKNTNNLILSLYDMYKYKKEKSMENANHFCTHTLFSNDGNYIAFLHRWIKNDVTKRWSRLIVCDLKGNIISISPTNDMVSHFVIDNKNRLLAYCRVNGIDSHVIFEDLNLKKYKLIYTKELNSDGHQSFNPKNNSFVTDTYPDKRRYAKLFIGNINGGNLSKIAELKSFKKFQTRDPYKHWVCDLHPRWNRKGNIVCFDSVHTGKRALCTMKINDFD